LSENNIVKKTQRRGTAMNTIGQKLDAVICEIAAFVWLVRVAAR